MDSVPSTGRDIINAAVDLECVPGIFKYTLNLSACTKNDPWMNFKQHASVCNQPKELCGFDSRLAAQNKVCVKFQDTVSVFLIHILPLWFWVMASKKNLSAKSYEEFFPGNERIQ